MPSFDAGQTGITPGVTILTPTGAVHTARTTAGIAETVAGSGVYRLSHPAPGTLLLFVFDTGPGTVGASVWDDGLSPQEAAQAAIIAQPATISDGTGSIQLTFRMLLDSDNDGIPDDPPVGVPDVRCLLFTDAAGTQPVGAVKLTDTQGYARWYGLAAGTYYMRREKAGMLFDDDPLVVEVVEPL